MKSLDKLNLKNKKYIIFDMDGTLIDSVGIWNLTDQKLINRYADALVDLDLVQSERDAFVNNYRGDNTYIAYCEHLINKYNFSIRDAEHLLEIRNKKSGEILENEIDFKDKAPELILRFKKAGFILILATMTTQIQIDIYSKKNKKMLKQMDISQVFDLIITRDCIKNPKPNPEIYNTAMQHYNASPDECLVFEDSYTGILASKNAGIEVVNIYDKYADLDRGKINTTTDYVIDDYGQFIKHLDRLFTN